MCFSYVKAFRKKLLLNNLCKAIKYFKKDFLSNFKIIIYNY